VPLATRIVMWDKAVGTLRLAHPTRLLLVAGRLQRRPYPTFTDMPPSTGSAAPVMKFASSEARNSAALATSQAVPMRLRSGTLASRMAATSARDLPDALAR